MNFSNTNIELWNFVVQMGIIAAVLLLANILRRKVSFIRKSLMPAAVLAGFLLLALRLLNILKVDNALMETITYHSIAIGFIALTLVIPKEGIKNNPKNMAAPKTGSLIVSTYLLQGAVGLVISIVLAYTIRPGLFKASGILLPMGFGQGPGQANNVGLTYEALGFSGGQSFGLSVAAMGFLVACVVGVIYLNILKRKNLIKTPAEFSGAEAGSFEEFENKNEIPVSESVDRFSIQVALVFAVYLLTWLTSAGITKLLYAISENAAKMLIPIIWGFNFIIGSLLAIAMRGVMQLFRKRGWMTRQYQNNYLLTRISGYSFDLMIITGICTINFQKLSGLWLLFILMTVFGTIFTLWYLRWICKKLYPAYYYEGLLSLFGNLTGTISSGMLLLRELDPKFETPAANNLILGSSFAIGFGVPMLVLIGMAPKSDAMVFLALALIIAYFFLLLLFMLKVKSGAVPHDDTPRNEAASPNRL
jgi:ESS family glutamate:Na+ symporter